MHSRGSNIEDTVDLTREVRELIELCPSFRVSYTYTCFARMRRVRFKSDSYDTEVDSSSNLKHVP